MGCRAVSLRPPGLVKLHELENRELQAKQSQSMGAAVLSAWEAPQVPMCGSTKYQNATCVRCDVSNEETFSTLCLNLKVGIIRLVNKDILHCVFVLS